MQFNQPWAPGWAQTSYASACASAGSVLFDAVLKDPMPGALRWSINTVRQHEQRGLPSCPRRSAEEGSGNPGSDDKAGAGGRRQGWRPPSRDGGVVTRPPHPLSSNPWGSAIHHCWGLSGVLEECEETEPPRGPGPGIRSFKIGEPGVNRGSGLTASSTPAILCGRIRACGSCVCVVQTPRRLFPEGSPRAAHPGLCGVRVGSSPAGTGPLVREQGRASTHYATQPKTKGLGQNAGQVQSPFLCRKLTSSGCWSASGEGDMGVGKHGGAGLPGAEGRSPSLASQGGLLWGQVSWVQG